MLKQDIKKNLPRHNSIISWGLVIAALLFIIVIRVRLLSIPLERDEGEFAYVGQLILQGIPPYSLAANMKLPGIYAAYALIMAVFGQTIEGIHLGLLFINLSTMLLVFLLSRRLFDDNTGVVACASYGILSLNPSVLGTAAHATHFILLPALGGIILLLKGLEINKSASFFLSGILLGLAFIMKQSGIFFGLFALLYLIGAQIKKDHTGGKDLFIRAALYISGLFIPYIITCIALYALGVFEKFWFWTVLYAYQYGTLRSVAGGIKLLLSMTPKIVGDYYLLWGLAGVGLIGVILDKALRIRAGFMFGFLLFSLLAICPGFFFREHYFVLMLPAVAIFSGVALNYLRELLSTLPALRLIPGLLFLICFSHGVFLQRVLFFELSPDKASRKIYFFNPFPESIKIADYIRNHSTPDSTIAVFGSEPQIYFYTQRRSATSYLYTYSLMENQKYAEAMQKEMIQEIEASKPEFLISINIFTSWLARRNSLRLLSNWYINYAKQYSVVGIIDVVSLAETKYLWEDEAQGYRPGSNYILLLKRTT